MLRNIEYTFLTDVSGQSISPICEGKEVQESGTDRCPEMSVRSYHYTLLNTLEELRSHLLRGESLKPRIHISLTVLN